MVRFLFHDSEGIEEALDMQKSSSQQMDSEVSMTPGMSIYKYQTPQSLIAKRRFENSTSNCPKYAELHSHTNRGKIDTSKITKRVFIGREQ